MLTSLSATYDDLPSFKWFTYSSSRGTTLVNRDIKLTLKAGTVFGMKEMRGGKYRVVFAEHYKTNFTIEGKEADRLKVKAKPRRIPKFEAPASRKVNVDTHSQSKDFRRWDADYFKAKRNISGESREGVDFSNYQWRKLNSNATMKIDKTLSKNHIVHMGTVFGVRFIKPATGGIYIDKDGRRLSLSPEKWEEMLSKSQVLPLSKWPKGQFTVEQLKAAAEQDIIIKKTQRKREQEAIRAQREIERRAKQEEAARERDRKRLEALDKKEREKEKLAAATIAEAKRQAQKKKPREVDLNAVNDYYAAQQRKKDDKRLQDVELGIDPDELGFDDDDEGVTPVEPDTLDKILDIPDDAEISDDAVDPVTMLEKVVAEKRAKSPINLSDFAEPTEDDDEYDDADFDIIDEDDDEEQEDTDPDAEYEDPEADEEEALADTDEEIDDVVDEELGEEAEDDTTEDEEDDGEKWVAEAGDVVNFNSDSTNKRDFAILSIEPMPSNDSIMIYRVYDITTEPEGYHSVRINTQNKRRFEDMATFVRQLSEEEVSELDTLTSDMERLKDPIVS